MLRNAKKPLICLAVLFSLILLFTFASLSQDVPNDMRYGRGELSKMDNGENMVAAYDQIVYAVDHLLENVSLDPNKPVTVAEFQIVMQAYQFDNCNQFWTNNLISYSYNPATQYVTSFTPSYVSSLTGKKATFDSAVTSLYNSIGITSNMSDFEKTLRIHDALIAWVSYDSATAGSGTYSVSHTSYGAIVNKTAVCQGYAGAYQLLLSMAGIQSHLLVGQGGAAAATSSGVNHAWNLVRLGNKYYLTDVTWDDQGKDSNNNDRIYYQYLNRSSAFFTAQDHHVATSLYSYPLPACNSDDKGYYQTYGGIVTPDFSTDEIAAILFESDTFRVYVEGSNYSDFWTNFTSQITEILNKAFFDTTKPRSWKNTHLGREYVITVTGTRLEAHSISVTGGTTSASIAAKGTTITLTANNPKSGYYFSGWTVKSGGVTLKDASATTTTFKLGTADVVVEAVFLKKPTLYFQDSSSFDIPAGSTGTAISSVNLASAVSGGVAPYTYSMTGGPSWLKLSSSGTVTGTRPSTAQSATTATFRVTDHVGQYKTITIAVGAVSIQNYTVTVTGGTASVSSAPAGTTVTLTASNPPSGQYFVSWSVTQGSVSLSSTTSTTATFKMPSSNVAVTAVFQKIPALVFTDSASLDVPAGGTGKAISTISFSSAVSGGVAPYTFTKVSGPSWLKLSSSGNLTGTRPSTEQAATTAVIRVTDAQNQTKDVTISVGKVSAPATTAPATTAPATTAPATTAPATTAPATTVPETTAPPATTSPETEPETTEPETTEPETTEPLSTEPETTEPETTEPDITEPESTEPETTEPLSTEPETTEPESTEPESTEPEATEPETTEPETTEPESTEALTTEPETTSPETTSPETKAPESTKVPDPPKTKNKILQFIEEHQTLVLAGGAGLAALIIVLIVVAVVKKKRV